MSVRSKNISRSYLKGSTNNALRKLVVGGVLKPSPHPPTVQTQAWNSAIIVLITNTDAKWAYNVRRFATDACKQLGLSYKNAKGDQTQIGLEFRLQSIRGWSSSSGMSLYIWDFVTRNKSELMRLDAFAGRNEYATTGYSYSSALSNHTIVWTPTDDGEASVGLFDVYPSGARDFKRMELHVHIKWRSPQAIELPVNTGPRTPIGTCSISEDTSYCTMCHTRRRYSASRPLDAERSTEHQALVGGESLDLRLAKLEMAIERLCKSQRADFEANVDNVQSPDPSFEELPL